MSGRKELTKILSCVLSTFNHLIFVFFSQGMKIENWWMTSIAYMLLMVQCYWKYIAFLKYDIFDRYIDSHMSHKKQSRMLPCFFIGPWIDKSATSNKVKLPVKKTRVPLSEVLEWDFFSFINKHRVLKDDKIKEFFSLITTSPSLTISQQNFYTKKQEK